jgi:hypothetical protein
MACLPTTAPSVISLSEDADRREKRFIHFSHLNETQMPDRCRKDCTITASVPAWSECPFHRGGRAHLYPSSDLKFSANSETDKKDILSCRIDLSSIRQIGKKFHIIVHERFPRLCWSGGEGETSNHDDAHVKLCCPRAIDL